MNSPTPLRTLVVGHSEEDILLLAQTLQRGGYEPTLHRVATAAAMKAALDQQVWDIVISDYTVRPFSGLSPLAQLRRNELDLPFIILSGPIGEEAVVEAMKAGAHDCIMKDNLTRLAPTIRRELREVEER